MSQGAPRGRLGSKPQTTFVTGVQGVLGSAENLAPSVLYAGVSKCRPLEELVGKKSTVTSQ